MYKSAYSLNQGTDTRIYAALLAFALFLNKDLTTSFGVAEEKDLRVVKRTGKLKTKPSLAISGAHSWAVTGFFVWGGGGGGALSRLTCGGGGGGLGVSSAGKFLALVMRYVSETSTSNMKMTNNRKPL